MNKVKIYLAGTIYEDPEDVSWKQRLIAQLPENVFKFYDPDPRPGAGYDVIPRDKRVIEDSDFVIAYIRKPSFGTTMEIKHAFDCGNITTFVIDPTGKNIKSIWLDYHIHRGLTSVDECAVELLKTIDRMKVIEP